VYTVQALQDLDEVAAWNSERYGPDHAAHYITMLRRQIGDLGESYPRGTAVPSRPDLRYVRLGKRQSGHGHIAVYRIGNDAVVVLHVFHTAQDWQARLAEQN